MFVKEHLVVKLKGMLRIFNFHILDQMHHSQEMRTIYQIIFEDTKESL